MKPEGGAFLLVASSLSMPLLSAKASAMARPGPFPCCDISVSNLYAQNFVSPSQGLGANCTLVAPFVISITVITGSWIMSRNCQRTMSPSLYRWTAIQQVGPGMWSPTTSSSGKGGSNDDGSNFSAIHRLSASSDISLTFNRHPLGFEPREHDGAAAVFVGSTFIPRPTFITNINDIQSAFPLATVMN